MRPLPGQGLMPNDAYHMFLAIQTEELEYLWCIYAYHKFPLTDILPGSGCSKLATSLVNVSLKFQMLISILCNHREFYNRGCSRMVSDFAQTY